MPSYVSNLPSRIWDTPQRLIYKDLKSIFPDTDLYHKCRRRILTHMTGAQHDGIITAGLLFFFSFSKWNVIFYALFFFLPKTLRWAEDDWKELSLTARQAARAKTNRNIYTLFSDLEFGLTQLHRTIACRSWVSLQSIHLSS